MGQTGFCWGVVGEALSLESHLSVCVCVCERESRRERESRTRSGNIVGDVFPAH